MANFYCGLTVFQVLLERLMYIYFSYGYIIVDTNGLQLPYTSNTMNTECMPLISVSLTYLIF